MKNIRHSLYLFLALSFVLLSGCTKYDFVETGRANGNHNTTMWEYFKSDPYNWSLLVRLSSRIGLQDVFEGKSSYGKEITFLGITNHSIRRYLLKKYAEDHSEDELNRLKQEKQDALFDVLADDLDANEAKAFILSSIIPKRAITLEEFKLQEVRTTPWPRARCFGSIPSRMPTLVCQVQGDFIYILCQVIRRRSPKSLHITSVRQRVSFILSSIASP